MVGDIRVNEGWWVCSGPACKGLPQSLRDINSTMMFSLKRITVEKKRERDWKNTEMSCLA